MRSYGNWLLGSVGLALVALLVTTSDAQEMDYPVTYYDDQAAGASAPDKDLATAAADNSGAPICYRCCPGGLLAGPLDGPEAWTLSPEECSTRVGGWVQAGYHSGSDGLLNDRPDRLNLHQTWLWMERAADGDKGFDWGYRADIMYGIDGGDTQAFGNPPGTWDYLNGWDHGAYAWAMPQLYGTVAMGDLGVRFGHFYTLLGYEVVPAPNNFFYSHALTWYNSEPFTHTGAVAEYAASDDLTLYGGWSAGWDTGFEQFNDGSAFLGGFSAGLFERLKMTYLFMAGNMGWRGEGYNHSLIFDYQISERWNYVLVSDLVQTDGTVVPVGVTPVLLPGVANDQVGICQYLFYKINYKLAAGIRAEWWKGDGVSVNEVTYGLNYRPIPNLVLRPEVRHQWSPTDAADFAENTIFGIDGYVTF